LLGVAVFDNRLHDEVAAGHLLEIGRPGDALQRRLANFLAELLALHGFRRRGFNAFPACGQRFIVDLSHDDVETGLRGLLHDAGSH